MTDAADPAGPRELPEIDLKMPDSALCPLHGEPFRPAWPAGLAAAVVLVLEVIQTDEGLAAEVAGDVARIGTALVAKPACERVPPGRLRQMYIEAGIGVEGICIVCGNARLGTEYKRRERGRVIVGRHVCFECVLFRTKPIEGKP